MTSFHISAPTQSFRSLGMHFPSKTNYPNHRDQGVNWECGHQLSFYFYALTMFPMCFQSCSSSSQHVPQGCSRQHLILSHMVCPQFSLSHLYTWAIFTQRLLILHLHIETSIILWSFQGINLFIYLFIFWGFCGDGTIKMMHCPVPGMYSFATNTFGGGAPPPPEPSGW